MRHQLQAIWLCGFIPSFIQSEGKEQKDIDLKPISQNTALITTTLNALGLHQNTSAQWRTEFVKNQNVLPVSSIMVFSFSLFCFFLSQNYFSVFCRNVTQLKQWLIMLMQYLHAASLFIEEECQFIVPFYWMYMKPWDRTEILNLYATVLRKPHTQVFLHFTGGK